MNEKKMIEELAKIDGIEVPTGLMYDGTDLRGAIGKRNGVLLNIPDYPNDHNAIQLLIDGMDDETCDTYMYELEKVTSGSGRLMGGMESNARMMKATPAQKCEAVLMAYGKHVD